MGPQTKIAVLIGTCDSLSLTLFPWTVLLEVLPTYFYLHTGTYFCVHSLFAAIQTAPPIHRYFMAIMLIGYLRHSDTSTELISFSQLHWMRERCDALCVVPLSEPISAPLLLIKSLPLLCVMHVRAKRLITRVSAQRRSGALFFKLSSPYTRNC